MAGDGADEKGRAWFRPPAMADPGAARVAAAVPLLSLAFLAAVIGFGGAAWLLLRRPAIVPIPAAGAALLIGTYLLAHQGWPRLAARALVIGTWLCTSWAIAITGSVNSPALRAYLIVILAAGFLIGRGAAVAAAALSTLTVAALAVLETRGMLPELVPQTPGSVVATALTLFVAAAGLLWEALFRLEAAVSRAERSEARTRALIDQ